MQLNLLPFRVLLFSLHFCFWWFESPKRMDKPTHAIICKV